MECDWQPFLKQWSQEALSAAEYTDDLPAEAIEAQWLGKAGATEGQIAEAETRLGITFPPSYREFLAVTNGWYQMAAYSATSTGNLWPTVEVDWFCVRNQYWIDCYVTPYGNDPLPMAPDSQYFVYGAEQDGSLSLRLEYLQTALEVSDAGDGIYLLNPKVVTAEGEWEAWFFANWIPGAVRYRSFREMMQEQYKLWKETLPLLSSEMTEGQYNAYSDALHLKSV